MTENWCKECGAYLSSYREHACPPSWQAIRHDYCDPEDESTFYKAFGHDAEHAALDIAERKFSEWEYPRSVEIWVRKNQNESWIKFEVLVEAVPSFTACALEGEKQ